ncbi:MAG: TetR/AcrR family transcriptional regulator, partial [Eubacterium sp.]
MAKGTHAKILTICKAMTSAHGLQAIEIRRVASECGIAVGTVYRYFPSKTALLMATVESIWKEIGEDVLCCTQQQNSFTAAVECLYTIIKRSSERYPGFYTGHSQVILPKQRTEGRQAMTACFQLMKADLSASLKND